MTTTEGIEDKFAWLFDVKAGARSSLFEHRTLQLLAKLKSLDRQRYEELLEEWRANTKMPGVAKIDAEVDRTIKRLEKTAKATGKAAADEPHPLETALGDAELWRDQRSRPYATVHVVTDEGADHVEHMPVDGEAFKHWLGRQFWLKHGTPPPEKMLREFISVVKGRAIYGGSQHQTWIRWARHDGRLYVDMVDEGWRVIEISETGWRFLDSADCPVRFRRSGTELPLPDPVRGERGAVLEKFRWLLNLRRPDLLKLVLGALVGAMRPGFPFPILLLICEPGSAKTTILRLVASLIDPRVAGEAGLPPSDWDLAVASYQGWLATWDNVGRISDEEANALCRLSTGGGYRRRGLYTDETMHVMDLQRPAVITALSMPSLRSDFVHRSLVVELAAIKDGEYLAEATIRTETEAMRPAMFALLLDAAACALKNEKAVRERLEGKRLPRLSDFAVWAEAAGEVFGWEPDEFIDAFEREQRMRMAEAVEDDEVLAEIVKVVRDKGSIEVKASELMEKLSLSAQRRLRSPRGLAVQLELNRRPLEAMGVRWSKRADPHSSTAGAVHRLERTDPF